MTLAVDAVLFDLGGVIATSPFDNFFEYEQRAGIPGGFIQRLNCEAPDHNVWARFERGELDELAFAEAFEAEAERRGHPVDGREILKCLDVYLRPEMVAAVTTCSRRLKTALLTNNFIAGEVARAATAAIDEIAHLFDVVIESSKVGVRKPSPRFYEIACEALGVAPTGCVFLDDLGVNLKPARSMGMTTIKVTDPDIALRELETIVGFPLRSDPS